MRINTRDRNEKATLLKASPSSGEKLRRIPRTMDNTAPSAPPEDTPRVDPSANGFFKRLCITAPARDNAPPVMAARSTRGIRTMAMIVSVPLCIPVMSPFPKRCLIRMFQVSESDMGTLPRETATNSTIANSMMPRIKTHMFHMPFVSLPPASGIRSPSLITHPSAPGVPWRLPPAWARALTAYPRPAYRHGHALPR